MTGLYIVLDDKSVADTLYLPGPLSFTSYFKSVDFVIQIPEMRLRSLTEHLRHILIKYRVNLICYAIINLYGAKIVKIPVRGMNNGKIIPVTGFAYG